MRRRPVPRAELINGTKDTKFETPVLGRNLHSVTPKKQSKKEPTLGEELNGTYTPKTGNKIETPEVSPKDEFSKKTKRGSKELSSEISEYNTSITVIVKLNSNIALLINHICF